MKIGLSIRQPWSWLIVQGYKPVENRTWRCKYRGPVYIHAGKKFDYDGWIFAQAALPQGIKLPDPEDFQLGGLVGKAQVVDCVTQHESPWFFGPFGFVIEDAQPLDFYPMPGKLGFFEFNFEKE